MMQLKVEGDYLVDSEGNKTKLYITRKTRNAGQIGEITSNAKKLILKQHSVSKNNIQQLLSEQKINKFIKNHIANQNRQDAKSLLRGIFKSIYKKIGPEQEQQPPQSYAPPKTKVEASAFKSYDSNFLIYDIHERGYDGLVHILLAQDYIKQKINRFGHVKVMVRVECWVISKKSGDRITYPFTAR